jgi:hypothetical protein
MIAFAGGWFLRDCEGPPPPVVETAPVVPECPPVPEPVPCEPEGDVSEPAAPSANGRAPRKAARRLPSLAPRDERADRRALLAWARRETPTLRECVPGGGLRMTVRLSVGEQGEVVRAALHPIGGELPPVARACLEARLRAWRVPDELRTGARELVFGVSL